MLGELLTTWSGALIRATGLTPGAVALAAT